MHHQEIRVKRKHYLIVKLAFSNICICLPIIGVAVSKCGGCHIYFAQTNLATGFCWLPRTTPKLFADVHNLLLTNTNRNTIYKRKYKIQIQKKIPKRPHTTPNFLQISTIAIYTCCISWQISKLQIWKNTAGKSAKFTHKEWHYIAVWCACSLGT